MSLRPLLELAHGDAGLGKLGKELASATPKAPVEAHVSPGLRPFLIAALAEEDPGLAGRPILCVAADDRGARDLATELGAYLAPRRVRFYPSRGTGYESHLAPPPHLVGLRIAALDALAEGDSAPVVVASAIALAEAVPDASLRPAGFTLSVGEDVDLSRRRRAAGRLRLRAGRAGHRPRPVRRPRRHPRRLRLATEDRAARIELFGDEIEIDPLLLDVHPALARRGRADRARIRPPSSTPITAILAEVALADADDDGPERPLAELLPTDRFGAFLDLIAERPR